MMHIFDLSDNLIMNSVLATAGEVYR